MLNYCKSWPRISPLGKAVVCTLAYAFPFKICVTASAKLFTPAAWIAGVIVRRLAAVKEPVSVKGAVGQVGGSGTLAGGVARFVVQKSSTMGPLAPAGAMWMCASRMFGSAVETFRVKAICVCSSLMFKVAVPVARWPRVEPPVLQSDWHSAARYHHHHHHHSLVWPTTRRIRPQSIETTRAVHTPACAVRGRFLFLCRQP